MPYVKVSSNVAASAVDATATMAALSKAVGLALSKPETAVMVELKLDQSMFFGGSDAVRALTK